jgi:hypothetical protein
MFHPFFYIERLFHPKQQLENLCKPFAMKPLTPTAPKQGMERNLPK